MKKYLFLATPLLLVVSGCAQKWHKAGATEADFYNDRIECISIANSLWPANRATIGTGYTTPINTNCNRLGNSINCQQTGGQYVPPTNIDTSPIARSVEVRRCLQARGYTSE